MSGVEFKAGERVVDCGAEFSLPMHRHADARIIMVQSGAVDETDLDGRHRYCSGELIFRPPFFPHSNAKVDVQTRYVRLSVSPVGFKRLIAACGWRSRRGRTGLDPDRIAALSIARFGGDALVDEFATTFSEENPRDCSLVDNLAVKLRQANTDQDLLLKSARDLGIAPYQLTRQFKAKWGMAPREFRLESRLQRALGLIARGAGSIAEISAICGFSDQSHLTRTMAAATGMTPRKFCARFRF
jgi:AraC-like DNA-binding protein